LGQAFASEAGKEIETGMIGEQDVLIRARAHGIWEREGRPEGRASAHWAMASAEIAAEATVPGAAVTAKPTRARAATPARAPAATKRGRTAVDGQRRRCAGASAPAPIVSRFRSR
jgi:hypothetical protein